MKRTKSQKFDTTSNAQYVHYVIRLKRSLLVLMLVFFSVNVLQAKDLLGEGYEKSVNEFRIKTDGLACYFCAYGLERFFRKTKKIYNMDISLEKGLVIIHFVKGKKIPSAKDIKGYVHDAGFTARTITANLQGTVSSDGKFFDIKDSGQRVPIKDKVSGIPPGKNLFVNMQINDAFMPFEVSSLKLNSKHTTTDLATENK